MKKCWANSQGNCGNKITGEHIVSKSILEKKVLVQGFSWCKDEPKEIGVGSLVSNFLCDYHNNTLSNSDREIANFVSSIESFIRTEQKFTKYGFSLKSIPVTYNINGPLLEKWFIKTLINVCLVNHNEIVIHYDKILPVLFSDAIIEEPYGINFAVRLGADVRIRNEIMITPLFNEDQEKKELAGGLFVFRGFKVVILLPCSKSPIIDNRLVLSKGNEDFEGLQLNWHNSEISMNMNRGRKSVKVLSLSVKW